VLPSPDVCLRRGDERHGAHDRQGSTPRQDGHGLIIGQEAHKGKDLGESPMPFIPHAHEPPSAGVGQHPPGRLTEVLWLARMPLSGGLVSAVLEHLCFVTVGRGMALSLPAATDIGSFREPQPVDLGT
jgi:hypothetical protein